MHLAEGILPSPLAAALAVAATPWVWWSWRAPTPDAADARALRATGAAILFAATLLPIPVPVVGATSHLCLTPALALLSGVRPVVAPTFAVLLLQALFFGHGGLGSLGANTLTLGVLGPLVAVGVARGLRALGVGPVLGVGVACAFADLAVYVADAGLLAAALSADAPVGRTFGLALAGFAPIQVPLAVLEGAISAYVVRLLGARRPGLRPSWWVPAAGVLLAARLLGGCGAEALDERVFGGLAAAGGRPPTAPWVDGSAGELGLAAQVALLFGAGFVAGRRSVVVTDVG